MEYTQKINYQAHMIRQLAVSCVRFLIGLVPDELAVKLWYFRQFRKFPDFRNPQTFNEKIAWRKIHQRDPRFTTYADKVAVKAEIEKQIGAQHVIETLWAGDNPQDIPFKTLTPPYVIKTNHGCGNHVFVRAGDTIDEGKIIRHMRRQLRFPHGRTYREWCYASIPRKVLIERMIQMPDGKVPEDYKFYVYDGRVRFIQVNHDRFTDHRRDLYDLSWTRLPCKIMVPTSERSHPKPAQLEEMMTIAEKIGSLFDFVRVDLYATPQGILFGETTFYPGAGQERITPAAWDTTFGEPWKIRF